MTSPSAPTPHPCLNEKVRTRKNNLYFKIKRYVNSNIGLKFSTKRVINYWKHLTNEIVNYKSLTIFKIKLDEFMIEKRKI